MRQAIQRGSGEPFAAEDFGPIFKGQIGGHNQAQPFVGHGDHVEQQFGTGFGRRDVAEFIEDHEIESGELAFEPREFLVFAGFQQQRDQLRHAKEPDFVSLLAGGDPERRRQMRFSSAAIADE